MRVVRVGAWAVLGEVGGGLGAPVDFEFAEDGGHVVLDRLLREVDALADLAVGELSWATSISKVSSSVRAVTVTAASGAWLATLVSASAGQPPATP